MRRTGVTKTPALGFSRSGHSTSSGTWPGLSLKVNLHHINQHGCIHGSVTKTPDLPTWTLSHRIDKTSMVCRTTRAS